MPVYQNAAFCVRVCSLLQLVMNTLARFIGSVCCIFWIVNIYQASAQISPRSYQALAYTAEMGIAAGGAEYFGDLNTHYGWHAVKASGGIFYRKLFSPYVAARIEGEVAMLGYSDVYNKNVYQHTRNLSFNTTIWELTLMGEFNFFRFIPGSDDHRFTPYIAFGIGVFHFNPYAYYQGQKYYLQPLGTEGQGSFLYPDRKPYALQALCFPVGAGIKYNLSRSLNIGLEAIHRFTTTDYLDDVSKTYVGITAFPPKPNGQPSIAAILQDRSNWNGQPAIGTPGRQRGNSLTKDQYIFVQLTLSVLLSTYRCPTM